MFTVLNSALGPKLTPDEQPAPAAAPTHRTKAEHLAAALVRWTKAGFKIASEDERERRRKFCAECSYWKPDGNLGLGACSAPSCGCTRAKLWLASESCPVGKWQRVA